MNCLVKRVLRDLPGIMEIERLCLRAQINRNPKWSAEWEQATAAADRIGKKLFGLSHADTKWSAEDVENGWADESEWEDEFTHWTSLDREGRSERRMYDLEDQVGM